MTITSVSRHEIQVAAGPLQMCAGLPAGCEPATHALARIFAEANSEALILLDASNAFNSLNWPLALRNISINISPGTSPIRTGAKLRFSSMGKGQKGDVFGRGNTEGDPLRTAMFAIAFRPLIDHTAPAGATQFWFADYVAVGGTLLKIRNWWDALLELGPSFGYHITVISLCEAIDRFRSIAT